MSISGKRVRLESEPLLSLAFNTMKKKTENNTTCNKTDE